MVFCIPFLSGIYVSINVDMCQWMRVNTSHPLTDTNKYTLRHALISSLGCSYGLSVGFFVTTTFKGASIPSSLITLLLTCIFVWGEGTKNPKPFCHSLQNSFYWSSLTVGKNHCRCLLVQHMGRYSLNPVDLAAVHTRPWNYKLQSALKRT